MLKEQDLLYLQSYGSVSFDGTIAEGFDLIVNNNQRQNRKKGSLRTPAQVLSDTAKGLGFEHILSNTGLFTVAAPAVENPDTELNYEDRQKDFWYNGQSVQVKTITKLYGTRVYFSEAMYNSISKSIGLNDFFIFGLAQCSGERDEGCTRFTYQPAFVISSETLQYIFPSPGGHIDISGMTRRPDHFQPLHPNLLEA